MTGFERYVELYSRDLTRFCTRLCGDIHDAEDLFQDTWTRAYAKRALFVPKNTDAPEKEFKNWLFTICVNLYRNTGRQKYNAANQTFRTNEEKERFFASISDDEKDIDAYIDLYDALRALPKKHRLVIVLFYYRAFSVKEIAHMLSIPEGTVKSRLNTAKNLLKRRLSDE